MSRYFFDLKLDGEKPSRDEEGMQLPDIRAAQVEAARALYDFAREVIGRGHQFTALHVIVRTEESSVLEASLRFQAKDLN